MNSNWVSVGDSMVRVEHIISYRYDAHVEILRVRTQRFDLEEPGTTLTEFTDRLRAAEPDYYRGLPT